MTGPKLTPFLWFDNQAEEAATFYVGVFPNSKILKTVRYGAAGPGPPGSVMTERSRAAMVFQARVIDAPLPASRADSRETGKRTIDALV